MSNPEILLAKKPRDPKRPEPAETLVGHTEAVMEAAEYLGQMLAPHLVSATRCSQEDAEHWKKALVVAAWLHDFGKANSHFQEKLRTKDSSFRQGVRHEAVSLLMAGVELKDWLAALWNDKPNWAHCGALFAIPGHHLKFPDDQERPGTDFSTFTAHSDFTDLLKLGTARFGLPASPDLKNRDYSLLTLGGPDGKPAFGKLLKQVHRELDWDFSESEKVLIAALKAALMDADLAGSALPRAALDVRSWLQERLSTCLTEQQLQHVVNRKLKRNKPWAFQNEVAVADEPTVLLEAGCGSGKTAAAYLWASRNARGKRLFFCYPTTGTASEGFMGYLADPDFEAILIHSRAEADYDLLEDFPVRSEEAVALRDARLEALETWPVPAVVCTAHTVLGLMEHYRRGLFAFPSIVRSAFVFDEIHALSDKVFGYLCRFLRTFPGAPVLLMTATLPPRRLEALKKCCESRGQMKRISGPEQREVAERYTLSLGASDEAWGRVESARKKAEKVLWICNTVSRATAAFDVASKRGYSAELFHSRYRYKDRLKRQRAVIDGFDRGDGAFLAITTQVAEISLDISADMMILEASPIPSMIQRLGRLNRRGNKPNKVMPGLFIMPESIAPYDDEAWRGVEDWLDLVCDTKPKSQRALAEGFLAMTSSFDSQLDDQPVSGWLDGLWKSRCDRSIMEAGFTIEVICEEDVKAKHPIENAIPMPFPRGEEWREWRREGRYVIAPEGTIIYDEVRGARWKTE